MDAAAFAALLGVPQKDAQAFLAKVGQAAAQEAQAVCLGDVAAPMTIADARALRTHFLAAELGYLPSTRELELVFRIPPSTASSVRRRVAALFPDQTGELLAQQIRMKGRAKPEDKQFIIRFIDADRVLAEHAWRLLEAAPNVKTLERRAGGIYTDKKGVELLGVTIEK